MILLDYDDKRCTEMTPKSIHCSITGVHLAMHILYIRVRHKPELISARAQEYSVSYLVLLELGGQGFEEPRWMKMP